MSTIETLEAQFGTMRKSLRKNHNYLGMEIGFCDDGSVNMWARAHIREAIEDFGEVLGQKAPNPAGKRIFNTNDDVTKLPERERKRFHSLVQKLLWVTHHTRPDIGVPISFLTKRVRKANVQDKERL